MNVYITNRNLLTWPKKMAEIFATQGHNVTIVDNNSSWPPLLDWYNKCPHKVARINNNDFGCGSPWWSNIITDISEHYVTCDADLGLEDVPSDWPDVCIEALEKYNVPKIGLSLKDTDCPSQNPAYLIDQFDKFPKGNPDVWKWYDDKGKYCNFPVDYHFNVWNKNERPTNFATYPCGIRTNKPYTARHLPWHLVMKKDKKEKSFQIEMTDEFCHYYLASKHIFSVTSHRFTDRTNWIKKYKNYEKLFAQSTRD
jgi:hypothetical protein